MAKLNIRTNPASNQSTNIGALPSVPILVKDAAISRLREGIVRAALTPSRQARDRKEYDSYLNTPVYGSFIFGNIQNKSANNYIDQFGETKSFTPLRFHECTFQISQSKNIVTTALQGINGTVKEYASDGDLQISINGKISGVYNSISDSFESSSLYPSSYVQDLVAALKVPAHIPISNEILAKYFNTHYAVVTNYSFPRATAGMNYQDFTIDLISDRPLEIVLSEADLENNQTIADLIGG